MTGCAAKIKNEVEMKLIKEYYKSEITGNTSKPRDAWRQ